ncbi:MAG: hypothetical protein AAFR83_16920 [Cyanobacteria bacterium J06629_18]
MNSTGEFPKNFREEIITQSIELTEENQNGIIDAIGESVRNDSNFYAPDTNLSDDEPDEVLGTKTTAFDAIAQLGNGEFILDIKETIELTDGKIFTSGLISQEIFFSGENLKIPIVDGTGQFQGIKGVQNVTLFDVSPFTITDISLEKLEEINGTRSDDNLTGNNISEFITGNNGNDTIRGGQGNDIIEGGRGGDIIRGGGGNDILAADRIDRFQDFDGTISELRGGNGDDIIYGGSKDDTIGGGNDNDLLFGKSGDDLIRGASGFDLLQGGVGNDTLRGQDGIDIADYSDLSFNGIFGTVAGLDVNLNTNKALHSSSNNALTWTDTLTTIENVIGTSRNDRFIGDENDNVFYGLGEVGRDDRQTEFTGLDGSSYQVIADVVEYDGEQSEFTFGVSEAPFAGGLTVSGSGIGTDTLIGIEFIKFDDGVVAISDIL